MRSRSPCSVRRSQPLVQLPWKTWLRLRTLVPRPAIRFRCQSPARTTATLLSCWPLPMASPKRRPRLKTFFFAILAPALLLAARLRSRLPPLDSTVTSAMEIAFLRRSVRTGATWRSFPRRRTWWMATPTDKQTFSCEILARVRGRLARPRRSEFPSRPMGRRRMAKALPQPSAPTDALSLSIRRLRISAARSRLPLQEFTCETRARVRRRDVSPRRNASSKAPVEPASQAAEKVGRFVGRGFSHDVSALDSSGVLTPEAGKSHFSAAGSACLVLTFIHAGKFKIKQAEACSTKISIRQQKNPLRR